MARSRHGRRSKLKPRLIPKQNQRICSFICLCQMTIVFSIVSILYLSVVAYMPAYRILVSNYEQRPIMCQTIQTTLMNNCGWASCGEWCLTRPSGYCPQMHATVRQNGSSVQMLNCSQMRTSNCPPIDRNRIKWENCNNGTQCNILNGFYNCTRGHCMKMSQVYECTYTADGNKIDNDKDNAKLNGYFECQGTRCTQVTKRFECNRICTDRISTQNTTNVFIMIENVVLQMHCSSASSSTIANGALEGSELNESIQFWRANSNNILIMSCQNIIHNNYENYVNATDCINGTLLDRSKLSDNTESISFQQFWKLANNVTVLADPTNRFVPTQSTLTIYNSSRLYINLMGCVNTLRGECDEFYKAHGKDGQDDTASSRYPCYYHKNDSSMVITRYDLSKTWDHLIVTLSVPITMFIIALVSLIITVKVVRVDDDTKMRCKYNCWYLKYKLYQKQDDVEMASYSTKTNDLHSTVANAEIIGTSTNCNKNLVMKKNEYK